MTIGGRTQARVAAIYDLHGNLPALNAVLEEIRREEVGLIVVGGDVVPGPMPRETLAALRDLHVPVRFIQGNGEVAVLAERSGSDAGYHLPEAAIEVVRWTARQLTPAQVRRMAGWPRLIRVRMPELGEVLFCHGTPRDENEIFTRTTAQHRLRPLFEGLGAALVVCGHTHMQFERRIGDTLVVNAGSVGLPFGEPGAHWLLLGPDVQPGNAVHLRRTAYDLEAAAARIRTSGYPQAAELARDILRPRSEETMLRLFAKRELGQG